jgi:hypothetical protein
MRLTPYMRQESSGGSGVESEGFDEPLLISATLRGLRDILNWRREQIERAQTGEASLEDHVGDALNLDKIAGEALQDMQELFSRLEEEARYQVIILGNAAVKARELVKLPDGPATLGEPIEWPAGGRHKFTYAGVHSAVHHTDMMPEPAHYYPANQLLIGSYEDGVIPFFRLADIHASGGYIHILNMPEPEED